VDVFLTSGAQADLGALRALQPPPGSWGLLLGHERGFRLFVERLFPVGRTGLPSGSSWRDLNRVWDGRVIGVFAHRPAASFKKRLLGPEFFGKLYLEKRISGSRPGLKAYAVDHRGRFVFSPLALKSNSKERGGD
jgi:hypothetical protein